MKQIVRQYSMDVLKQISDTRQLRWLIPHEARENQVYYFHTHVLNKFLSTATFIGYYCTFY